MMKPCDVMMKSGPWPSGRKLAAYVVGWGSIPGQVIPKSSNNGTCYFPSKSD